jgi:hypothetical protein
MIPAGYHGKMVKKEGGHFKKCNALHFSIHPPPADANNALLGYL